MVLSRFIFNGAPGGSSPFIFTSMRGYGRPTPFIFFCGLLRVLPDLRKPDTADSANAHHFTQRNILLNEMNCSVTGAARLDTVGS